MTERQPGTWTCQADVAGRCEVAEYSCQTWWPDGTWHGRHLCRACWERWGEATASAKCGVYWRRWPMAADDPRPHR